MKALISDKDFCKEIALKGKAGSEFKKLCKSQQYTDAAHLAAKDIFSKPFAHPIREADIPKMAALIKKEIPEQITVMQELADKYWLKAPQDIPANASAYDTFNFHVPNTMQRSRGIAIYSLARLFYLTDNKRYMDGAFKMLHEICGQHGDYLQGDSIGFFSWHPHTEKTAQNHGIAHIAQELNMMLPFVRSHLSDEDKLYLLKVLWTVADLAYRAFRKDQSFNLSLHFLTACHGSALLFPQFKQAKKWVSWSQHNLQEFYHGEGVTKDGYFREGVLYQRVNHHLLELNEQFMHAAGHKVPKAMQHIVREAHYLNADICGPDGFPPLIGDSAPTNPHEHWIHTHEALHVAAAIENKKSFKDKAGTPYNRKAHERNLWDMGLKGMKRYLKMPTIAEKDRKQGPADRGKSGFQILGSGKGKDRHFGALLFTQNHNHSHFDIGSIHIYSKGRCLINDPSKASYGTPDSKDEAAQSHSLAMLPRFSPAGPRLQTQQWARSIFAIHKTKWQATSMEHKLYEGFRMQRTFILCNHKKDSYWIVLDKVTPNHKQPLGLHELVDTSFHLNAVETHLGIDDLNCWSKHDPSKQTATRYAETDSFFKGPGQEFDVQELRRSFEFSDSAANLQIAGFSLPDTEFSLQEQGSHTCELSGRVKRPSALYKYRGPLPTVLAYVLVPFNGIKQRKPIEITGKLSKNEFTCHINDKKIKVSDPFSKRIQVK